MRVTDQQITALTQFDMNNAYENMAQAQTILSTGHSINTPSDNPIGTAAVLELQGNLAQSNGFSATVSDASSWLQSTDSGLNGINDVLLQARTLGVQGADDTLTQQQRQAIAANVGQLLQQAVQLGNTANGNRYVMGGFKTNTPPFTINTSTTPATITYQGDTNAIQREISPGQSMQINVVGSSIMPVFSAIAQLQSDLQTGSGTTISNDLKTIDSAQDTLLVQQATVGANESRMHALVSTLQLSQQNITSEISQLRDADMATAAVNFSQSQATYQASLQAAAKVVQPTLLEFLK